MLTSPCPRINIEASAALADWIDLYRQEHGGGLYRKLVERAVGYLPKDVLDDLARPANVQEYEDQDHLAQSSARHEADYFNAAVRAIDNAIALMRLVEGRVALYEKLVSDARGARDDLTRHIGIADARLRTIDVELEEARHDVGVASG